ncbi:hypothetical protein DFQ03_3067 [Maribacter caenipelagi]|uniref:Uncharacterized protein n=1 Tax=Maribacter caenipelagi TaxID=1447781 RepID=A0A4R7CVY2_9FLAO|nr:hypothetical protein [Maribacter caenipelagi]TDS12609.1 hypothetical protein DFQ03_3067 [Maribacter caenipelagi]
MFKKSITIICLFALIISCDKLDELTKFDMEYSQRATIPSTAGIDLPFDVFTPEMETNSESTFEVNDTRKDLIEEIKLTELEMVIISPDGADFSFLNSIEVYISADGLEEIKIAYLEEVPEDAGTVITLETSDLDLKEYIKSDEFSLRLNTVTDELMSSDHELEVNSTFFVDAKILGL